MAHAAQKWFRASTTATLKASMFKNSAVPVADLRPFSAPDSCLGTSRAGDAESAVTQLNICGGGPNGGADQKWRATVLPNSGLNDDINLFMQGVITPLLQTDLNKFCASVDGSDYTSGKQLVSAPCKGETNQRWVQTLGVTTTIQPKGNSGLCMTAADTTNGESMLLNWLFRIHCEHDRRQTVVLQPSCSKLEPRHCGKHLH